PYGIKRLQKGGNGRKLLIDFDSLDREIQEAIGDPRKCDHILERYYKVLPQTVEYFQNFKRGDNYLHAHEQEQYIVNASVMLGLIDLEKDRMQARIVAKGSTRGIGKTLWVDALSFNDTLKAKYNVTHNLPSNEKRFREAYKAYKGFGNYTIIKDPEGRARKNASKVDAMVLEVLNGLFVNKHKPTASEIARTYESFLMGYAEVYNTNTGELYDPKQFPRLSEGTIRRWLAKWENKIATHKKRSGNRQQYIAQFNPYGQMDLPKKAGSIISIDDRNPPFWYAPQKRMWFYIGIDVASGCITTFVYGKTKEGIIQDFYRQMVRFHAHYNVGMPIELECESSLNSSFKDTFLREGQMFRHVNIHANSAQSKIIERRFGAMRYEVEKKAPGWIARPFAKSESNQAGPGKTKIIPYEELVAARLSEIEDWNNAPHHDEPGMSRFEYWLENQHEDTNPINYKAILPHLGYKTATSCSRGYITLQGRRRAIAENGKILTGDALIEKMRQIEGKKVDVYWLDDMQGGVLKAMAYIGDRFICEVMEMPRFNRAKAEQTPDQKAAIELQSRYAKTVIGYAQKTAKSIETIGFTDLTPKPSRKFKIDGLKRYEANEDFTEVEVLDDIHEDDQEIIYNQEDDSAGARNWQDSFLK
ncbi:hypothetical protein, partial [Saccharicrinis fermentans]|uniref:hypothetical protein n=1 Tax=Saccharicrinis fermentans TaxID=982 RepID=UPI000696828F